MNTSKGSERINDEGAVEINVETVDFRKAAGPEEEPPHPKKMTVTHLIHDEKHKDGGAANVVGGAAAEKLQSFNEAVGETISRMQ